LLLKYANWRTDHTPCRKKTAFIQSHTQEAHDIYLLFTNSYKIDGDM